MYHFASHKLSKKTGLEVEVKSIDLDQYPDVVVEMNIGQILRAVKRAVTDPEKVFLANRIDGVFITPDDIRNIIRFIQGKGA